MDPSGFEGVTGPQGQQESPEAVRVWLLGGFRVSVGRRTIEGDAWRLRKAAAVVKLLALAPDHRLHREQVMDLLWPDSARRAASNNLRQVLYGARRILDPASDSHNRYLSLQDEQLALCPGGQLHVDVDAFEEAVAIARRSRDPATYRAAIELYAGDLLPEDRYEEWTEARRENLRQMYLALLIELAGLYEERGQHELALVPLRKAVAEEPTFEDAHAALMRLYALSGRPREALAQYERLRGTLSRRFGTEPGETTKRLSDDIAAGSFSPDRVRIGLPEGPPATAKHNLPAARTSFVGREQEIVEVKRELAMTRLLTLTGAGGTGKTRLALEVAKGLVGTYPDGVWLVELAGLSEGALVPQAIAAALGVQEQADQSLTDKLVDFLREMRMLLVLDNCEHLIDAVVRLADTLLDSCPHLTVLATSRQPLGVAGGIDRLVQALSAPDVPDRLTVEELERYETARLFAERALFVERTLYGSSGFALGPENARAVAEICSHLEGLPLAIELAAAWVGTLSVEQISERLQYSLGLLKSGSRTITSRQRTLRGAMDWSFNLLSEPERRLFRRLSVFAGGWTLEAAEAVSAGDGIEKEAVLELLWRLVNKSLVVAESGTQGAAARYRMLEPIRQFAREKLEESREVDEVQTLHAEFYLELAEEAEPELAGAQQGLWVERLEAEHDNLREALSWMLEAGEGEHGLRFGAALWRFWLDRGYLSEGIGWLDQVLAGSVPGSLALRVKALEGLGWLTQTQGDTEGAEATYDEMLELSRESDDKGNVATALNSLGALAVARGDNERARALLEENLAVLRKLEAEGSADTQRKRYHSLNLLGVLANNQEGDYVRGATLFEECLALARDVRDTYLIGIALSNLGYTAVLQRDYERARALSEEALALAHELGSADVDFIHETLVNLGLAALGQGERERADASFDEALAVGWKAGRKPSVINTLEGMASLAGVLGEATRAANLWGAAQAAREATGIALPPNERALHEPYLDAAHSQFGEGLWEEALAEGRAMSLEEAAEYALAREPDHTTPSFTASEESSSSERPVVLTPRENEVALLVSRGLTNRQIASQLMLSEHTVATHVRNALKKLGLYSRRQIAAWVTEPHKPLL
jgi:predicted ATPase/DNA-binding SARP family transcriptional activator/DNA-binding CsgD family transcriptional regulator